MARGSHENLIGDNRSNSVARGSNLQGFYLHGDLDLGTFFEYISVRSRPKLAGQLENFANIHCNNSLLTLW